jgi:hypothetical protein
MSIQHDQVYRIDARKRSAVEEKDTQAEAAAKKGTGTGSGEANKRLATIAGAVVILFAAVWFFFLRGPSSSGFDVDHPTGFHFVCGKGHEFTKSEADLRDYQANHLGEPIKCPKCGDTHVRPADAGPRAAGRKTK